MLNADDYLSDNTHIVRLPHTPLYGDDVALRRTGYYMGKLLGEGAYAKVYMSEYIDPKFSSSETSLLSEDNTPKKKQILACKVMDSSKAPKDFLRKFFPREIAILCQINHHYLVRIHSIVKLGHKFYMFMNYCPNGDLLSFMKENGAIREPRARRWFAQLLEAVDYLHNRRNIAHRDIKCENILLNGVWNIKLADFGFARTFHDEDDKSITFCGSVMYAPPEVVHGNPYNPKLADLWSLGVVLFIMLNKSMPFDDTGLRKLYEAQVTRAWKIRSKLINILTREVKSFLYNILEPNADLRRPVTTLRRDVWIQQGSFSDSTLEIPDPEAYFLSQIN